MENPWLRFVLVVVLVLDFTGDFEEEDEDENEEDGVVGYFSHRLIRRQRKTNSHPLPRERSVPIAAAGEKRACARIAPFFGTRNLEPSVGVWVCGCCL